MININLNDITQEHLTGNWVMQEKSENPSANTNIFAKQRALEFLPSGVFKSINGNSIIGTWQVSREKEIIYNPQLKFYLCHDEIAKALITRLYETLDNGVRVNKLTLYFNTGLEIILKKAI